MFLLVELCGKLLIFLHLLLTTSSLSKSITNLCSSSSSSSVSWVSLACLITVAPSLNTTLFTGKLGSMSCFWPSLLLLLLFAKFSRSLATFCVPFTGGALFTMLDSLTIASCRQFLARSFFNWFTCSQILSAGPSLMLMADMRWSAWRSMRACPSISCTMKSST